MTELNVGRKRKEETSGSSAPKISGRDTTSSIREAQMSSTISAAVVGYHIASIITKGGLLAFPVLRAYQKATKGVMADIAKLPGRVSPQLRGRGTTANVSNVVLWREFVSPGRRQVQHSSKIQSTRLAELTMFFVIIGLSILVLSFFNPVVPRAWIGTSGVRLNQLIPTFLIGEVILLMSGVLGWLYGRRK